MQFVKSLAYLFDAILSVMTLLYENLFLFKPFGWLPSFVEGLPDHIGEKIVDAINIILSAFLPGTPNAFYTLTNATNVDLLLVWGVVLIVHSAFTIFFLSIVLKIVDLIL